MIRSAASVLVLFALGAPAASAQHPAKKPVSDSLTTKWTGDWEGTMSTPHGEGTMHLAISRTDGWKVNVTLGGTPIPSGEVKDFTPQGDRATWVHAIMDMSCKANGSIIGGTLKGETECSMGTFGFVLRKKGSP
jgi:hypothetical protein